MIRSKIKGIGTSQQSVGPPEQRKRGLLQFNNMINNNFSINELTPGPQYTDRLCSEGDKNEQLEVKENKGFICDEENEEVHLPNKGRKFNFQINDLSYDAEEESERQKQLSNILSQSYYTQNVWNINLREIKGQQHSSNLDKGFTLYLYNNDDVFVGEQNYSELILEGKKEPLITNDEIPETEREENFEVTDCESELDEEQIQKIPLEKIEFMRQRLSLKSNYMVQEKVEDIFVDESDNETEDEIDE